VHELFSCYSPLEGLRIAEWLDAPMVESISTRHCTTLQKLHVVSRFSLETIKDLVKEWPALRDIQLVVKRTQGEEE
jgi:hypothetical protein